MRKSLKLTFQDHPGEQVSAGMRNLAHNAKISLDLASQKLINRQDIDAVSDQILTLSKALGTEFEPNNISEYPLNTRINEHLSWAQTTAQSLTITPYPRSDETTEGQAKAWLHAINTVSNNIAGTAQELGDIKTDINALKQSLMEAMSQEDPHIIISAERLSVPEMLQVKAPISGLKLPPRVLHHELVFTNDEPT